MSVKGLTREQRRAASLLDAAVNLCTIMPLASQRELAILNLHMSELLEFLVQQQVISTDVDEKAFEAVRDLAFAICVAATRLSDRHDDAPLRHT